MLEWSLACTWGSWESCRILHNSIHPSTHLESASHQRQKETTSCTRLLHTEWALDEKCLHFLSVWSDIVALIPIRQYLFLFGTSCRMRWWHLRVGVSPTPQSQHLLDVNLTHLGSDLGQACQKYVCMIPFWAVFVRRLSLARFFFQSKFGHHISVWQQSVRVNCSQYLYWALVKNRVANSLRLSHFISYWLLRFVFASLLEVWIELLMHWGRSTVFTSSSSQLLDSNLLQDFCSSPNLVITFLFGNIVWESTEANNCIGHWHETGLQTFYGSPSSSHIGCSDLCLHHYWKFG